MTPRGACSCGVSPRARIRGGGTLPWHAVVFWNGNPGPVQAGLVEGIFQRGPRVGGTITLELHIFSADKYRDVTGIRARLDGDVDLPDVLPIFRVDRENTMLGIVENAFLLLI